MNILSVLIVSLVVIGLITLVGHGIWILFAAIFRPYFGESKAPSSFGARCLECGVGLRLGDDFCHVCGQWQRAPSNSSPISELAIAARQLDRLLNQGQLDLETHRRAMQAIEDERERLTAPSRRVETSAPRQAEPQPAAVEEPDQPVVSQPAPAAIEPSVFAASQSGIETDEVYGEPARAASPIHAGAPQAHFQPQPSRSFTEMLESFMEESSIRWGELVGGLLIIGCSIALVVSLWSEISARPFLKFSVFIGMTAGVFGLGFYSAHRWRLPTTSRAALIISTLLVPLNFLAMTAFSPEAIPASLLIVGVELLALALFIFLVYKAAQVFAPASAWTMVVTVLGPSFAMLMARHSSDAQSGWIRASLLGIAPLAFYWLGGGAMLRNLIKRREAEDQDADQLLVELGIASFATLLPLGLLFVKPGYLAQSLRQYAPLISLFGVPAIAMGIALLQGAGETQSGGTRTAATSVAILGSLISLAALLFAWPNPTGVTITALVNCLVCAAVAVGSSKRIWRYDLRLAHAGAMAHLTLAFLVIANLFNRNVVWWSEDGSRLANSFVSKTSGVALLLIFVLFAAMSEFGLRTKRGIEARLYGIGSVAIGAFSLLLVTAHGFGRAGDPHRAWLIYAFYAVAAFAIAWRRRQTIFSWAGNALLLLAIVQLLAFRLGEDLDHPVRLSLLVFASITTVCAVIAKVKSEQLRSLFSHAFTSSALIASSAVAPFALFGGWMTNAQISTRMLWLAAIWLVLAWLKRWPALFAAVQIALSLCVVFGVAALFGHQWPSSFFGEVATMQAQAIALALLSLAWIALRLILGRFGAAAELARSDMRIEGSDPATRRFDPAVASRLLYSIWPSVDRVVALLLVGFLAALSVYGAHVGMIEELFPGTALGAGSWLLLLTLALVLIVGLWERFEKRAVLAMVILLACACLLIAGRWGGEGMAVALDRWLAAFSFALVTALIVLRDRVARLCRQFGWPQMEESARGLARMARALSLVLFVVPVLVATLIALLVMIVASSVEPSLAARIETVLQVVGPVLLIGLSFIAHAARERSAANACAAGLMGNLAVTLGYLLAVSLSGAGFGGEELYRVAQLNLIATAIFSLVWLRWARLQPGALLKSQIRAALFSALSLLAIADALLFFQPTIKSALANSFGGVVGWLTVALPMLAFARFRELTLDRLRAAHLGFVLLAAASLAACIFSRFDNDNWIAYHALMLGVVASAWAMLAARRAAPNASSEAWVVALACAAVLLILRGMGAPGEPWWTVGAAVAICLLFARLSVVSRNRAYIYLANAAINLAVTRFYFWAIDRLFFFGIGQPEDKALGLATVNAIAIALPAIAWLWLDLRSPRRESAESNQTRIVPFHRAAVPLSLGLMSIILSFLWLQKIAGGEQSFSGGVYGILNWVALASVIALPAACLRDEDSGYAPRGLYVAILLAIGMVFARVDWRLDETLVGLVVALSLHVIATTAVWRGRQSLAKWLIVANAAIGAVVFALAFATVFNVESLAQRLIAATACFAIPVSAALLAMRARNQSLITNQVDSMDLRNQSLITAQATTAATTARMSLWNQRLITICVQLSLLTVVLWGWAWLSPTSHVSYASHADPTLAFAGGLRVIDRLVILMAITELVVIAYRFAVRRHLARDDEWRRGLRAELWWMAATGLASLAVVLGVEAANYFSFGAATTSWLVVIAVLATLIVLVCASLAFALLPGQDPFNQDERGRMKYVYGAELLVVLTMLHLRLTMPWLFGGFFRAWWPLAVMLLAFAGVGLGELFRRRGKLVLAEPLERTGIMLPLLPVIGFWLVNSEFSYSGALLLVGLFYGVLSVTHRSFKFGLLAALAGNGGLWNLLSGVEGYRLHEHPQLWLIPIALSVLVAARVNRDSLTRDQMTTIRYSTLIVIYVSSTADIFINGVSESPWLTMVLAVLSVAGVIAGLMLRVRAFLFLGAAFLLLSVVTMIWTASANLGWVWLWYVAGIAFGALIFYVFALFERKRREMLGLVERLKQWQA